MKLFVLIFATGLLISCEGARLRRQFFPDDFDQGSSNGDQFGNQFFSGSRFPQNRPNQGFNNGFQQPNQGFNNGFQQQPNNGFQQRPNNGFQQNQGFNNNNQGFNNNNNPQPNQGNVNNQAVNTQPATQAPAATPPPTTLAPAVQSCIDSCGGNERRTTGEYNPVCGSDNNTYHNPSRLTCAQDCGARVTNTRAGACRTSK